MSKMNLLIDLKGYDGTNANVCNTNFARNAQYAGIDVSEHTIQEVTVGASETKTLFSVITAEAKKFIYLETDGECEVEVNGIAEVALKPIAIGHSQKNGVYLKSSDIESVAITNNNATDIKIYYIAIK